RRRHTRSYGDWSSDVCSSDLAMDLGERFYQYLRMLANEARRSGATPVLFMTWYPGNEAFFRSTAEREKVRLLPVGRAWRREFDRSEERRVGKERRSWCARRYG